MKNGESYKKMLRQRKIKNFSTLKYKPTVPSHTNSQEDEQRKIDQENYFTQI